VELDTRNIDDAILGLLYLTLHEQFRAWKSMDWDALDRLHERGLIDNPANKAKSVVLTDEGLRECKRLFEKQFAKRSRSSVPQAEGGRRREIKAANGATGFICRSAIDGSHFFRVYESDGNFVDYDIQHDELEVTISAGAMASFYRVGDEKILDHSPEVLGLHDSEKKSK
jgi:hypothetical protein